MVENRYYFGEAYERYWNDPVFLAEQLRPFQGKPVPAGNAAYVENLSMRLAELSGLSGGGEKAAAFTQHVLSGGGFQVPSGEGVAGGALGVVAVVGTVATVLGIVAFMRRRRA